MHIQLIFLSSVISLLFPFCRFLLHVLPNFVFWNLFLFFSSFIFLQFSFSHSLFYCSPERTINIKFTSRSMGTKSLKLSIISHTFDYKIWNVKIQSKNDWICDGLLKLLAIIKGFCDMLHICINIKEISSTSLMQWVANGPFACSKLQQNVRRFNINHMNLLMYKFVSLVF